MNRHLLTSIFLCAMTIASAQIIGPYQPEKSDKKNWSTDYDDGSGWWPFTEDNQLKRFYNKPLISAGNYSTFAFMDDASWANFIDAATYIDHNSWFRLDLGFQVDGGGQDTSEATAKSIAIQKFITNGGNLSLNFERPLGYWDGSGEYNKSKFFLINAGTSLFLDVPQLNQTLYNPAAGVQFRLLMDGRLVTRTLGNGEMGSGMRMGFRGLLIQNFTNHQYNAQDVVDFSGLSNAGAAIIEGYFAFAFLELKYTYIPYSTSPIINANSFLNVSIIPVSL